MKQSLLITALLGILGTLPMTAQATPAEDVQTYRDFFMKRFPGVPLEEFANGVYSIDQVSRDSWEAIEEFPPYEPSIEDGEAMWNKAFANGKSYSSCFPDGPAIMGKYPHWDDGKGMVMTLPLAVNNCRTANGEKPLKYAKGSINKLLSYIGYESRGQVTNVGIPNAAALAAYEDGKQFYFARRGQLNMSCSHCHMQQSGRHLRTDVLSPALGHTTGFPVYRSKWGGQGTLHRRYKGCNKQVRAKPFKPQGEEYRNLEYFMTHMNNGIAINSPSARK
ncbi:MAG TPA: sulfur oxidation c-type cytochrome SoxA [Chromatiaceae bacterium]|jgi:sulfur-oxidizing protein SoxA|nr:sulfur oxidation c-type cytochrome SoxA [Chromatiaceae bacterium]HIA08032.1 sulfur oxidation c-type cytochrome SoxA [Chromatiaceae bacterium]HIB83907.1 sulfur oxidation c-type cytochrome SoxA [Chromatiaceae bacterium]HIN81317.1 sulfur oxidation c-type cytochrome SoxA [Chromatiales bacterium]HIO54767.1 sulfur oxidation c-type cytochrome SoxA [Chromatiales bacterium]